MHVLCEINSLGIYPRRLPSAKNIPSANNIPSAFTLGKKHSLGKKYSLGIYPRHLPSAFTGALSLLDRPKAYDMAGADIKK
jgi:hypothetical protein